MTVQELFDKLRDQLEADPAAGKLRVVVTERVIGAPQEADTLEFKRVRYWSSNKAFEHPVTNEVLVIS